MKARVKKQEDPNFLKKGDIFVLEKGMDVYLDLPKKFVYDNRFDDELDRHKVTIGEKFSFNSARQKQYADEFEEYCDKVIKDFAIKFNLSITKKAFMGMMRPYFQQQDIDSWDSSDRIGEYIVTSVYTSPDASLWERDPYPGGRCITARFYRPFQKPRLFDGQKTDEQIKISFYQSGCFTAMITPDKIKAFRHIDKNGKVTIL